MAWVKLTLTKLGKLFTILFPEKLNHSNFSALFPLSLSLLHSIISFSFSLSPYSFSSFLYFFSPSSNFWFLYDKSSFENKMQKIFDASLSFNNINASHFNP